MRRQSVARLGAAALVIAGLFSACGDDDDDAPIGVGDPDASAGGSGGGPSSGGTAGAGANDAAGAAGFSAAAGAAGSNLVPPPVDVCDPAIVLEDASAVTGNTAFWPHTLGTMCSIDGVETGAEVAYRFTAPRGGVLDVRVEGQPDFTISVRSACADDASELGCSFLPSLRRPIGDGETVYIVVQGIEPAVAGPYTLTATVREPGCGDGSRDAPETCDDGNQTNGDGCSADCTLEASETEGNDTPAEADELVSPFFASIGEGDVDYIAVAVTEAPSSLVATVRDFGDQACQLGLLNSVLELIDESGAVLGTSDDQFGSYCSHLVASALPAGTYYLAVSASPDTLFPEFPYALDVALNVCGDGVTQEGESCDPPAFGCSAACQLE